MKIFGHELWGIQSLTVKCPKGNHSATVTFIPSEKNLPIPFDKEMREALEEAGMQDLLSLPKCDDLHFFCMKCMISLNHCEVTKTPCLYKGKTMGELLKITREME